MATQMVRWSMKLWTWTWNLISIFPFSAGFCNPAAAVLEHSGQGDLCTFLRSLGETDEATEAVLYARLVEMSGQVAAGMRYLEARNIVHKDLAAR